jgi:ribosomal-protein-alanine N-acetyltransferase
VPASGNTASAIRPAQQADLEALLAIDRACFEPQWGKGASTLAPALGQAPCFAVAELGGRPVGYAFAMDYFGGRQVHLVRIAVLPEQRGQAIGIALLAHVVEFARQRRAEVLTLNTQEYNSRARALYEWFGFRRTGERQLILHAELV